MADHPSPAKPATNGAAKPVQSPLGRGIPALTTRAPTKHPRNTAVLPAMIERLAQLVESGATVKEAADTLKVGYSTAQWYLRERRRGAKKTETKKKGKAAPRGFRLSPEQVKIINRLLPKMPQVRAEEIAKQANCHISSVYSYRRLMLNDEGVPTADASEQGITTAVYAEMRDFNKRAWNDCWNNRVELTDAELRAVITWRRMNAGGS